MPGPRPTSMPRFILIRPPVWPQYTNVTDRHDRTDIQTGQRSDSIGRTVLQTVAQNQSRFQSRIQSRFKRSGTPLLEDRTTTNHSVAWYYSTHSADYYRRSQYSLITSNHWQHICLAETRTTNHLRYMHSMIFGMTDRQHRHNTKSKMSTFTLCE